MVQLSFSRIVKLRVTPLFLIYFPMVLHNPEVNLSSSENIHDERSGSFDHPFHVSVCDIVYESDEKHLKISLRMFLDDLEEALIAYTGDDDLDILNYENVPEIDKALGHYLSENFSIGTGRKELAYVYLGGEIEVDVMWCYIEIEKLKPFKSISIENTIFFEIFDDQENLVHVRKDGKVRSVRLTKGKSRNTVEWE